MSATLQQPMLYAAVPFERDGAVAGVARVAEPLGEIDDAKSDLRRLIWLGVGGRARARAHPLEPAGQADVRAPWASSPTRRAA